MAGAIDPVTRTLYVASLKGAVFAINIARCNAATTSGADNRSRRSSTAAPRTLIDVDVATDTVYAANDGLNGSGTGDTLSVIDGAQCNGHDGRGCHQAARTTRGVKPKWATVDQKTNTVYVANTNDGTVSVINGARCNATVGAGCARPPADSGHRGRGRIRRDRQPPPHPVRVNSGDDTLSAISTARCTGAHTAGCPGLGPAQQASSNQGPGYAQFPSQFALMPSTGSAYIVNVGGSNVMAVADVSGCDAINTSACRHDAPSVSHDHGFLAAIDPATNTIYASSTTARDIDVLNALTCRAGQLSGCAPIAAIPIGETGAALARSTT